LILAFFRVIFHKESIRSSVVAGVTSGGPWRYPSVPPASNYTYGGDPGGSGWQIVSEEKKILDEIRQGSIPLWNPNQMFGTPLAHNLQISPFFPLKLILLFNSSEEMWTVYKLVLFLIAGVFTFLYLNTLKLHWSASLVGGLCYMLSGSLVMYAHFSFMDVLAMIPVLLFLCERLVRAPSVRSCCWLGFAVGVCCLSGYPVPLFLTLLFPFIYTVYRSYEFEKFCSSSIQVRKRIAFTAGAYLLGMIMGLPLIAPGFELLLNTENARPPGVGLGKNNIAFFYADLFPYILDFLKSQYYELWCNWHGLIPILLAFAAIKKRMEKPALFFLIFSLFGYLKLGGFAPAQWIAYLPVFNRIIYTRYLQPEISMSIAILAAFGAQRIICKEISFGRIFGHAIAVLFVAFAAVYSHRLLYKTWRIGAGQTKLLMAGVGWVTLFIVLSWMIVKRQLKARLYTCLIVALVGCELAVYCWHTRNRRYDPFTTAPYLTFLQNKKEKFRVLGLDGILYPPYSSAFDIDDVRWMNALVLSHYKRFIREFVYKDVNDRFDGAEPSAKIFDMDGNLSRYLTLVNTRYLLTNSYLKKQPRESILKLVYDKEIRIYENPNALPRAFVVRQALFADNEDKIVEQMKAPDFNPSRTVILEKKEQNEVKLSVMNSDTPEKVSINHYGAHSVTMQVQLASPALLFFSDIYYPKWKALVNGKQTKIYRANLAFRAVYLETGLNLIEFRYEDRLFVFCCWVASATVLVCIGLLIFGVLDRRCKNGWSAGSQNLQRFKKPV
ncbi:MAG: hypothetical protein HY537_03990, partial [Deltaproteobacteria bacterium]|nr:hypothetical protein [Deltaproteobacteria bacterium]